MTTKNLEEDPYILATNVTVDGKMYCWYKELQAHSWCPNEEANMGVQLGKNMDTLFSVRSDQIDLIIFDREYVVFKVLEVTLLLLL